MSFLGAVVNQSRRFKDLQGLTVGWIFAYFVWKGAVAVVFAFVLYFMFMSGLIAGEMFPAFINTTVENGGKYVNMVKFATVVDPESYREVAKILVWCFIAGYSERFVPNLISRVVKDSSSGKSGNDI